MVPSEIQDPISTLTFAVRKGQDGLVRIFEKSKAGCKIFHNLIGTPCALLRFPKMNEQVVLALGNPLAA